MKDDIWKAGRGGEEQKRWKKTENIPDCNFRYRNRKSHMIWSGRMH